VICLLLREYEIDYLKKHGIRRLSFKKVEYSINKGFWGRHQCGGKESLHLPVKGSSLEEGGLSLRKFSFNRQGQKH